MDSQADNLEYHCHRMTIWVVKTRMTKLHPWIMLASVMKKLKKIMKNTNKLTTLAALAGVTLAAGNAGAAVAIVGQLQATYDRTNSPDMVFDASGADKLVVVVTGQHGFNNNAGKVNSLTYDGVALIPASYRTAVTASTDTLYHGIFYLDNPATSAGVILASVENRGHMVAFLLTGTADGVGATAMSANGTRTVDLTTTAANSFVMFAQGLGGAGNFGDTRSVTADSGTILSSERDASNWTGHVIAGQAIATPGTNTFAFTGGNVAGGMVAAVEFLEATTIPEPTSTALLGLAGLALLRRRRK